MQPQKTQKTQPIRTGLIEDGVRLILEGLGCDSNDHNFSRTPQRVAKAYAEIFSPARVEIPVFDEDYTDLVVMKGHRFYTLCPHHLLPVELECDVAYIPCGKVIGASKLVRMVHDCNRTPMTQEALTTAILDRIDELTEGTSMGAAIKLSGSHGCMKVRGVQSPNSTMITLKFSGVFDRQPTQQRRFLELINGR